MSGDILLAYGPPRTASTLQFQILCASHYLRHSHEPEKVLCRFSGTPSPSVPPRHEVIKSHKFPAQALLQNLSAARTRVFATAVNASAAGGDWRPTAARLEGIIGLPVAYVQVTAMLARSGAASLIATDYAPALGLTSEQTGHLIEYIRYWSILRQCCGFEMSADWHAVLRNDSSHVPHHASTSSTYPDCGIYSLDAVEAALLRSHVYQRFRRYARRIRSFSANDGEFDGTYCSRFNRHVVATAPKRHPAARGGDASRWQWT